MRRLRDFSLCLCLLLLWPLAVNANDSWRQIQPEARGQTVWFNAWGGDPAVNRYLAWVSEEVKRHYAIDLRIVPIADAADAVKRIQTEAQAGRRLQTAERSREQEERTQQDQRDRRAAPGPGEGQGVDGQGEELGQGGQRQSSMGQGRSKEARAAGKQR